MTLKSFIGLVGLPRSGTTMLTSILAVHPRIATVYEPWNRGDDDDAVPLDIAFDDFVERFGEADKDVLLVKETTTHLRYLDNIARFMRSAAPASKTDLIILWRNPLHVFLSEIEALKKWWGEPNIKVSPERFDRWAEPRVGALGRMIQVGREFNALLVFYERLVRDKERVIPALMAALGIEFDPRQLEFEKYVDREQVHGDLSLATQPRPISDGSVRQRAEQLPRLQECLERATWYARVMAAAETLSAFEEQAVVRLDPATSDEAATLLVRLANAAPQNFAAGRVLSAADVDELRAGYRRRNHELEEYRQNQERLERALENRDRELENLRRYLAQVLEATRAPVLGYALQTGSSSGLFHDGWATREMSLRLRTERPVSEIAIRGYIPDHFPELSRAFDIEINGELFPYWLHDNGSFEFQCPVDIAGGAIIDLTVRCDAEFNASAAGQGGDERNLAYHLNAIALLHEPEESGPA